MVEEVYDFRGILRVRAGQLSERFMQKSRGVLDVYRGICDKKFEELYNSIDGLINCYEKREEELNNLVGQLKKVVRDVDISLIEKTLYDSKEAAVILNPDDTIRYINKAFLELVGQSDEGIVGKDYAIFLRGYDGGFRKIIKQHFENPRRQHELVFVKDDKGDYHRFGLSKTPLFVRRQFRIKGENAHLCSVIKFYPISWFRRAEDYSTELEEKLEKSRKEVRTPLKILREANEIFLKYFPHPKTTNP